MPRDPSARENRLRVKAKRDAALARVELRGPTVPRRPASGATSHAVKVVDVQDRAAIDAFLARRRAAEGASGGGS